MNWIYGIYYPIKATSCKKNDWRIDMELTINDLSKALEEKSCKSFQAN